MLTQDTKKHIDAARQVLVGVVPNPMSQVEQITNALIYKFMDDMDQQAIKAGGDPSFFTRDLEKYAWTKLMSDRLGNQERTNIYTEALMKFSEAKQLPQLFRDIFRQAFLPYRDPEVLGLFLKEISYFDYSHSEELGNAYEYLLSIMSSQGDAGQFRTPRHIIDFIVDVVAPSKDDTILDPACGTAGFLISAYNYIKRQNEGVDTDTGKVKQLTSDERKKLVNNFQGYDIDPTMVRMSQVNMYLHKFTTPKIYNYNTLSSGERWNDKFDVILANPPFMSPKGGIKPHNKFSIQANRAEVLFVDYIMNHLKPKGRAGIIVPEGIIFQSGKAYKELRKNLVNDGLFAVVSLPAGVFNPYSGVKTSILFFDNEVAKKTKDLLFVKVTSDGYDLGAQRRKIEKDDLGDAGVILKGFRSYIRNGENQETIESFISGSGKGFIFSKEKIAETGDFNLSADSYKIDSDILNTKWPKVQLGEIADILNGYAFKSENYVDDGIRVIRITNVQKGEIVDDNPKFYPANTNEPVEKYKLNEGDLLISLTGNVGRVGILKRDLLPAALNQRVACLRVKSEDINPKFLYYFLNKDSFENECIKNSSGVAQKNLSTVWLSKYEIPLPPLEVQKEIVEQIEVKQNILDGAKAVVENWKPDFNIDNEWQVLNLSDVARYFIGLTYSPEDVSDTGVVVLRSSNIQNGVLDFSDIVRVTKKIKDSLFVEDGDILMCSRNGSKRLVGKIALIENLSEKMTFGTFMTVIRSDHSKYLSYFFNTDYFRKQINESETSSINQITKSMLDAVLVPMPPIEIENKIIERIEEEKRIVESNKKLIEIMKKRISEVLETI